MVALVERNGDIRASAASTAASEFCPVIRPTVCWALATRQVAVVATRMNPRRRSAR